NLHVVPTWPDLIPGINPNAYTVSIEHEGQPEDPWTQPMVDANNRLMQWLATQANLSYLAHHTLAGHNEIDPVDRPNCPGPNADLERLAFDANGGFDAVATAAAQAAQAQTLLVVDESGALYKFAQRNGGGCTLSAEFKFTVGDDPYVGQAFEQQIAY